MGGNEVINGKSYPMGHLTREENSNILKSISNIHPGFSVDSALFKNETVEWVRVLGYWKNMRANPIGILIWIAFFVLLVPCVIEPIVLSILFDSPWNVNIAMAPFMIAFIFLSMHTHVKGSIQLVTNYRVVTIEIGRISYTCKYILHSCMSNNSISVAGNSVKFVPNRTNNKSGIFGVNHAIIRFSSLDDAVNVKQICDKLVDMKAAPIPSSSIVLCKTGQPNNTGILSEDLYNMVQSYLSANSESLVNIYKTTIADIPKDIKWAIISGVFANIWMSFFTNLKTPQILQYMILAQLIPIVMIYIIYKLCLTPSILTNKNILATGLLRKIRPIPLNDTGLLWCYHQMNGAKGTMFLTLPANQRIDTDDLLSLEEYVCSRVHELSVFSSV